MESIREAARSIIREMQGAIKERNPHIARHYKRLAIIDYAKALRMAPHNSPEANRRAIESAYIYAEKSISLGTPADRMDEALFRIRYYLVPLVAAANLRIDSCQIASGSIRLQDEPGGAL